MDFRFAILKALILQCAVLCAGEAPIGIDLCDEKTGIVQSAKATALAAKMVDKCFLTVSSKYKYSPSMFQKGTDAYSEAVYSCIAKIAPLLTVQLNPGFVDANVVNATGMFIDAVECVSKNRIFTEDVTVSLALMKWILRTLF